MVKVYAAGLYVAHTSSDPKRLLDLRIRLHSLARFDLSLPHADDFVPHMTITEGFSGPTVDEALLDEVQGVADGGTFDCQGVVHVLPDEEFRFRVASEFRFGGG